MKCLMMMMMMVMMMMMMMPCESKRVAIYSAIHETEL